jgi:hypothetical protein
VHLTCQPVSAVVVERPGTLASASGSPSSLWVMESSCRHTSVIGIGVSDMPLMPLCNPIAHVRCSAELSERGASAMILLQLADW